VNESFEKRRKLRRAYPKTVNAILKLKVRAK
jgi:hypothetical protein